MVLKMEQIGANKDKANLRVYFSDVISRVENFEYIDNPNIQNKFHDKDVESSKSINKVNKINTLGKPKRERTKKKQTGQEEDDIEENEK